ncbi:type II secretion system protein J [Roseibium sp. MMSF_3412]|uniref:PulJ/GspJ family protein n=1 Tax=Roseibium sp. MMSF_3412 TaxID=3046712 RepID=UPI00273D892E|nr:type II secretion system protein [Roseibium sp. MMSF_3412]
MAALSARSGFSLAELLVSLLIMSMISMAAVSALSAGKQIWGVASSVPETTLSDAERTSLRRTIMRRISLAGAAGGGVSGTRAQLTFSGLLPTGSGINTSGPVVVQLTADGITVQSTRNGEGHTVHLRHLDGAVLSYFGRKQTDTAGSWFETWDASDPVPRLVKFTFPDTGKLGPDELVVFLP